MRYAFCTRNGWFLLSASILIGVISSGINFDMLIPIPGLSTASSAIPMPAIFAVILVVLLLWCVERGEKEWMGASVRSVRFFSVALFLVAILLSTSISVILGLFFGDYIPGLLLGRNALCLGFFSLVIWAYGLSTLASASPVIWTAFCCLFARDRTGHLHGWAWCLNRDFHDIWAWGTAGLLLVFLVLRLRLIR